MSSQILTPKTESAMLARILQADERELTVDGARYWLSVKIPAADQDRVDELSAKASAGSLTEAETQELDNYLHIGFLLGTMQAKARRLFPLESALPPPNADVRCAQLPTDVGGRCCDQKSGHQTK